VARRGKIVLHPIDLGFGRSRGQRGRPVLAGPAESTEVLTLFRELSKPFGTEIAIEDGVGVIHAT
jgi:poly-gamma-glutamate synthesis protein (capsule biosynthesis protein)